MTRTSYVAERIPNFRPRPIPSLQTLGDLGVLGYDCPFCPTVPESEPLQESGPRFDSGDSVLDLVQHYVAHRAHQMARGEQPRCPCCGDLLRPHYRPRGAADALYLRTHPARDTPEIALFQTELGHFLRGSLRSPLAWTNWSDPELVNFWDELSRYVELSGGVLRLK